MDKTELKNRTKQFALRAMKVVRELPTDVVGRAVGAQLVRSAMSVGANYRAACRGWSRAEFAAKLGVVLEECDESAYWLELIAEDGMLAERLIAPPADRSRRNLRHPLRRHHQHTPQCRDKCSMLNPPC